MELQAGSLTGKLSNLTDSVETVSTAFFKFAGEPIKAAVTQATNLVTTFISLPAPLQNAIFAAGVFTSALATLTVAVIGWELANGKAVATQTLETLGLIKNTISTNASAAAKLALALATGTATESQKAATISTVATGAAFAGAAVAIAAVVDSYLKVDAAAAKVRASIQSVNDALTVLDELRVTAAKGSDQVAASTNLEAAAFKRTTEEVGFVQQALDKYRDSPLSFSPLFSVINLLRGENAELATSVESSINRQKVAFGDLTISANNVLAEFDKLKGKGLKIASKEELEAEKKAIDAALASLEATIPVDAAAAASKAVYIKSLKAAKADIDALTIAQNVNRKALEKLTKTYTESGAKLEASAADQRATLLENLLATGQDAEAGAADLLAIDQKSSVDRLNLAETNLPKLRALKVSEKDPKILEEINAQILKLESDVSTQRIAIAQKGLAEQKRIEDERKKLETERLQAILENGTLATQQLGRDADAQRAIVLESLIAQGKDTEAGNERIAAIEQAGVRTRIAQIAILLKDLAKQKVGASPELTKTINAEIEKLEAESGQKRVELARGTLAEHKRTEDEKKRATEERIKKQVEAEQKALAAVKDSTEQALIVVKRAESDRLISIQSALNKGLITQQQFDAQRLDSTRRTLNDELFATTQQLAKLEAIPKFSDPEREKQRLAEIESARKKTSDLTLGLLENEFQKQEQYKKDLLKGIEDRAKAEKNRSDRAVAGFDREKEAINAILATFDQLDKLETARFGVQTARANLEQARTSNTITGLKRAEEIRKQLNDDTEESAAVRAQLERELAQITGSTATSQLQIIQRRQKAEADLVAQQQKAREREQVAARAALENDIVRNKLLADRAVIEARIAEIKSRQQLIEASGKLTEARKGTDLQAINDAETLFDLATDSVNLAGENVRFSQQQVFDQRELAAASREQLGLEQQAVNEQTQADTLIRSRATDEELVRAGGRAVGQNRYVPPFEVIIPKIPPLSLTPGTSPITPTAAPVSAANVMPDFKVNVQDILKQLQIMNTNFEAVARSPKNLFVQTPQPVEDASRVYSDIVRGAVVGAGLG